MYINCKVIERISEHVHEVTRRSVIVSRNLSPRVATSESVAWCKDELFRSNRTYAIDGSLVIF